MCFILVATLIVSFSCRCYSTYSQVVDWKERNSKGSITQYLRTDVAITPGVHIAAFRFGSSYSRVRICAETIALLLRWNIMSRRIFIRQSTPGYLQPYHWPGAWQTSWLRGTRTVLKSVARSRLVLWSTNARTNKNTAWTAIETYTRWCCTQ